MVVPVVIEGANKTESWFESTAALPKNCNLRKFVSLSQKLREWNTWLFESATRNRVHVETASIITPKPPVTLPMGGI